MQQTITANNITELPVIAKQLLNAFKNETIFAFHAPMGAGKTTFIKAICKELGVHDTISSPTFSLVNEYTAASGRKIFHFDFYRIKSVSEAYDMGYEDYFYSKAFCFIEWPEKVAELLPEHYVKITIDILGREQRAFLLERV
jgi:tRNA threonylcarbamoyladenosine biosynthesis protein TsaE